MPEHLGRKLKYRSPAESPMAPDPLRDAKPVAIRRSHWALIAIVLIRLLIGLAYSRSIPAWESYDEPWHFAYAVQIATHGTLPSGTDKVLNNERIQPPGYYLLLAAVLRLSGSDVAGFQYPRVNPLFYYGTAGLNYAIHPLTPTPTEVQIETALSFVRMFSVLIGLFGVVFTYNASRRLWPSRPELVILVTVIFAWWPQAIFNSSVVSNDGLALTIGALLTWLIVRLSGNRTRHRLSIRLIVLCLIVIALGTLVKINVLAFFVPLILVVLITASLRLIVPLILVGTAVLAGLIALLTRLPGVLIPILPQGIGGIKAIVDHVADANGKLFVVHALQYALNSGFGLFGWGNLPLPDPIQIVWEAALAICVLGSLWGIIRRRLAIRWQEWLIPLTIVSAVGGGALALAIDNQNIFLLPGRYLLPALSGLCLLLGMGWSVWLSRARRAARPIRAGLIGGLLLLNLAIPPLLIAPVYRFPTLVAEAQIPNRSPVQLAPPLEFLGGELLQPSVKAGGTLPVNVYFEALYPPVIDYTIHVVIVGPDGVGHGSANSTSGNGMYPSSVWVVNQPFRDTYNVPIQSDFPAPGLGVIYVVITPITPPFHDRIVAKFGSVMVYP